MDLARAQAKRALLVTAGVYLVFAGTRFLSPALAGFLLVGAFYFLPGWLLRDQPEIAREDQVGPESPLPPWSGKGLRVALVAGLVIFPAFIFVALWFYKGVCAGDTGVVDPLLWLEGKTPWAGSLEGFWQRQCVHHSGGFFPKALMLPPAWEEWAVKSDAAGWGRWTGAALGGFIDMAVGLFAVALPEEVFHRGYLMGALDRAWPPRRKLLGVPFGRGALISSLLFALGHLVAYAEPVRLATFVPALLFAWLWRRSGSLWAPALVHFASNLLMAFLLASLFARP